MILVPSTNISQTLATEPHNASETFDIKTIVYSGGALLFASAVGNGMSYAFGIYLARTLGASDFGLYALALTLFNILTFSVVFGMDNGAIRFISRHLAERQPDKARATLLTTLAIAFGTGLLAAIILAVSAKALAVNLYGKPALVTSLLFFAAAVPFATVAIVLLSSLQAYQTVRYTILIKYLWEPVAKFVLSAAALWAGYQLIGVLSAIVFTLVASAALALHAAWRVAFEHSITRPILHRHEVKELLSYCFPLAISNLFGVVAPRSDILILGYWTNSQEVGIYLAAFQTAAVMSLVLGAFNTALAPIIGRAWSQQDGCRVKESYQAVSRISATVSLPIFCILIIFTQDILSLFGPVFLGGTTVLIILAVGHLFNSGTGSANTILLMSGHSHLVMTNTVSMGMALLLATAIAIPLWGMTGAAVAASSTFIITNVLRVFQVWKLHRLQPYTWSLIKPSTAAVVSCGVVLIAQQAGDVFPRPFLALILGVTYLWILVLLGMHEEDRLLLQTLRGKIKSILPA